MAQNCLVTVGSTSFDELIATINDHYADIVGFLVANRYQTLTIQYGNGRIAPSEQLKAHAESKSLSVDSFRFSRDFGPFLRAADLVVCHGGAGTLFEALALGRKVFAVVNGALMGNHQAELVQKLAELKFLHWSDPRSFARAFSAADFDLLAPFEKGGGARKIAAKVKKTMA